MIYILFLMVFNVETGLAMVAPLRQAPSQEECLLMATYLNVMYIEEDQPVMAFCQAEQLV